MTLLMVCQAISIAITTVLPVPVAILSPTRGRPSLWSCVLGLEPAAVVGGAVPTGDLGEEDRRLGRLALAEEHRVVAVGGSAAQCASSLRVYGVTPFQLLARHRSTSRRMSLISEFCSRRSPVTSKSKACWSTFWRPFLLTGTGMNDSLGRRPGRSAPVGPVGPISKCCSGASYGELRIGLLMSVAAICCRAPLFTENVQPVTVRMLANSGEAKGAETGAIGLARPFRMLIFQA